MLFGINPESCSASARNAVRLGPESPPHPEEKAIVTVAPELADYVAGLKQRSRKVVTFALRQLLRLVRE
jgi:hypothetical protein